MIVGMGPYSRGDNPIETGMDRVYEKPITPVIIISIRQVLQN